METDEEEKRSEPKERKREKKKKSWYPVGHDGYYLYLLLPPW